jgi:nucleoside-diphosphate-sugar epimerase
VFPNHQIIIFNLNTDQPKASGYVGSAILKELLKSDLFDVTVLTRDSSISKFPTNVKVAKVDYTDLESISAALAGQDALVSAVGTKAIASQRLLIDAAVSEGVKRIIPSEFGTFIISSYTHLRAPVILVRQAKTNLHSPNLGPNLKNPKTRALPLFANTVRIEEYLEELARKGSTSYTLIYTGPFIDLALRSGKLVNFSDRKATIYDGGDQLVSTSRVATAGKAVRRVLTHPRETADRAIFVKDIDITQNQLLRLVQSLTPGEKWNVKQVSTEAAGLERERATFAPGFGGHFENVHNTVLGIREMTGPDLEELAASIFGTGNLE